MPAHQNVPPPVPVILIGCGAVSQLFYAPTLKGLENLGRLRVHALVDPAPVARGILESKFPRAGAYASLTEVPEPDAASPSILAIVASPPRFHLEHARAAFARRWHVLCEKPLAASSIEAGLVRDAAIAADRILAVGHYKRFFPSSLTLKHLCTGTSPLGPLRSFHFHEGGPFNWPAASPSFFDPRQTPGGVLLDIGVHVFDLLLWWLGDPDQIEHRDDAMGGLETNTLTDLRFNPPAGPVQGRVQLSRDWSTAQRYSFEFKHGRAIWKVNDANGLTLDIQGLPHPLAATLLEPAPSTVAAWSNPRSFIAQLEHVLDCIRLDNPVLVDGQEGVRALRLIEQCYARRRPLSQPWLTSEEQAAAARLASSTPATVSAP